MGNVERCDKTLPLNEMIFYVRRDAALRARWLTDLEGLAREFGLSREEYEALRDQDVRRLNGPGRAPVLRAADPAAVLRRSAEHERQPALEAYKRAFPEETGAGDGARRQRLGGR